MRAPSTFMLAAMALCIGRALAAGPAAAGYATDSSGNPVLSSAGECWRTSQWTPGMAAACQSATDLPGGAAAPASGPADPLDAMGGSNRSADMNSTAGLTDSSGSPVRSGFGQCWGTGFSGADPACAAMDGVTGATGATGVTGAAASTTALAGSAAPSSSPDALAGTGGGNRAADMSSVAGLTDSSGSPVRSGFGQCWGTGFSGADPACAAMAGVAGTAGTAGAAAATSGLDRSTPASSASAALAAPAAASGGLAPIRSGGNPAYLTDSNGIVVRSGQGECWRTGSWSPALATVVGCDGVLAKAAPVPAPAPSPKPVPPAEPQARVQPDTSAPADLAVPSVPAPPVPPMPAPAPVEPAAVGPAPVAPAAVEPAPAPVAPTPEPTPPAAAAPETRPSPAPAVPSTPAPAPAEIAPPQATPEPAPQRADAAPADSAEQQPKAEKVTLESDTYFDFDKATLKAEGKRKLDELASRIAAMQLEVVVATGHTDWTGPDAYNRKLSERRARAVKNYLVDKGLPADRIFTDGKGEKQPVATNKTREGRAKNRRVEVELVGTRR